MLVCRGIFLYLHDILEITTLVIFSKSANQLQMQIFLAIKKATTLLNAWHAVKVGLNLSITAHENLLSCLRNHRWHNKQRDKEIAIGNGNYLMPIYIVSFPNFNSPKYLRKTIYSTVCYQGT